MSYGGSKEFKYPGLCYTCGGENDKHRIGCQVEKAFAAKVDPEIVAFNKETYERDHSEHPAGRPDILNRICNEKLGPNERWSLHASDSVKINTYIESLEKAFSNQRETIGELIRRYEPSFNDLKAIAGEMVEDK